MLRLSNVIAFIIGAMTVAVPFAYVAGRMMAGGVSEEFIVAASKCRHDVNKIQELLNSGDTRHAQKVYRKVKKNL